MGVTKGAGCYWGCCNGRGQGGGGLAWGHTAGGRWGDTESPRRGAGQVQGLRRGREDGTLYTEGSARGTEAPGGPSNSPLAEDPNPPAVPPPVEWPPQPGRKPSSWGHSVGEPAALWRLRMGHHTA